MTLAEEYLKSQGLNPKAMSGYRLAAEEWSHERWVRENYICRFGFAIPTAAVIKKLKSLGPYVETGAGSGYWSYELKQAGVDVIATDMNPANTKYTKEEWKSYLQIEKISGFDAVQKYPSRTLLTVWPEYNQRWTSDMLVAYTGSMVVYVGEGEGGCTADDEFHCHLAKYFNCLREIRIPQFMGLHDRVFIYKRK